MDKRVEIEKEVLREREKERDCVNWREEREREKKKDKLISLPSGDLNRQTALGGKKHYDETAQSIHLIAN